MADRKTYVKPVITKVKLDPSFILMQSSSVKPPEPPGPRGGSSPSKGDDSPFQPPFGDKPFG